MTTNEILLLLQTRGFRFTHSLGQNFLHDEEKLEAIVQAADVKGKNVLEIGAGAGCLTQTLARDAKKVLTVEIDQKLESVLNLVLEGCKNTQLVIGDILKVNLPVLCAQTFGDEPFIVVANLPYCITTPVLFLLMESQLAVAQIVVMLQKEAVQRVIALPGEKEYGPLAIHCALRAQTQVLLDVPPHCFIPAPHVESRVIRLNMKPAPQGLEEAGFMHLVRAGFGMRRKTLVNNWMGAGYAKERIVQALEKTGIDPRTRAEALTLEQFLALYQCLHQQMQA